MNLVAVNRIKSFLRQYGIIHKSYRSILFILHSLREGIWLSRHNILMRRELKDQSQAIITWDVVFPYFRSAEYLGNWLREQGVFFMEGRYTVYLPPQTKLATIFPKMTKFYPPNTGFKILKDFRSPNEANYLRKDSLHVRSIITGNPREQMITANYMFLAGIGPRIWDVCCWKSAYNLFTVFVVDNVSGATPSADECLAFLQKLRTTRKNTMLRISLPKWESHSDFRCPNCNGNLVKSKETGYLYYVDFQNFVVVDRDRWITDLIVESEQKLHFGSGRPIRGKKYPYQSVPGSDIWGKRNTYKRWTLYEKLISDLGFSVENRMVLDIGCNAGMVMHSALNAGASWCYGWDLPEVVDCARSILFSLGCSRFTLKGAWLGMEYDLESDIRTNHRRYLDEAIVFYLSVVQHLGFMSCLYEIPWRILVFEGHQKQQSEDISLITTQLADKGAKVACVSRISDGDCGTRPLHIFIRR